MRSLMVETGRNSADACRESVPYVDLLLLMMYLLQ